MLRCYSMRPAGRTRGNCRRAAHERKRRTMQLGAVDSASASATLRSEVPGAAMLLLALALTYYLGVRIGMAFTPAASAVSLLWPPNAILLAALLLCPPRAWVWPLLAVLPPHMIAEVSSGVPVVMAASWY